MYLAILRNTRLCDRGITRKKTSSSFLNIPVLHTQSITYPAKNTLAITTHHAQNTNKTPHIISNPTYLPTRAKPHPSPKTQYPLPNHNVTKHINDLNKKYTMLKYILLILILTLPTIAAAEELYYYDSLEIEGTITNPIQIQATGANPYVKELTTTLTWVPQDDARQQVSNFEIERATLENGEVIFKVTNPDIGEHSFDLHYTITASGENAKVTKSPKFPLEKVPLHLSQYTKSTDTIDINEDIRELASALVANEDDLYKAVTILAAWTKENIEYDLSTINVEASQPSSWVLENREGVCDEMTNLFISFLRSLGIPARFVSGLSYTTSPLFDESWGAHGWAEVYFPEIGWVPFDVTYGQLGWVDATHIKFADGIDSNKYATSFEWVGKNTQIKPQGMQLDAKVTKRGNVLDPLLELDIRAVRKTVALESYNVIEVIVTNPTDQYIAEEIILGQTEGMLILESPSKVISLSPNQEEKYYWQISLQEGLDPSYQYTFPITIYSQRNATATDTFTAVKTAQSYAKEWAQAYTTVQEKQTIEDISFLCKPQQELLEINKEILVDCEIKNKREEMTFTICEKEDCQEVVIPQNANAQVTFSKTYTAPAIYSLFFTLTFNEEELSTITSLDIKDKPLVQIEEIQAPETIDYASQGTLHFKVTQLSAVAPKSTIISIRGIDKSWEFEEFIGSKVFDITIPGKALSKEQNELIIRARYSNDNKEFFEVEEKVTISIGKISTLQKIERWLYNLIDKNRL